MITAAYTLGGDNLITLLEIDFSTCVSFKPTGTTTLRCTPYRNDTSDIVYNGNTYSYIGFEIAGLRSEINGGAPTPTISFDRPSLIANSVYIDMFNQQLTQQESAIGNRPFLFDPRGAKVKIIKSFNLDVAQQTNTQEYIVSQAVREGSNRFEWQLCVGLGIDNAQSESIAKLAVNRCNLRYRRWNATTGAFDYTPESEGGCPYGNPTTISNWSAVPDFGNKYFTNQDAELTFANRNLDKCSYSAAGCQKRFDPAENGLTLPFVMLYSPNTIGKK